VKKFTVPCDFGGQKAPFSIYVGEPSDDFHPLHFQQQWLSNERGGSIPKEVMDSFEKLYNIAKENPDVTFEDLCLYAFGRAAEEKKKEQEK
jgi:hypothetical protein